ncbi:MAG: class I SAM-dependent methyltransferase [Acidobacteriota bacterium]|nr:class I SAM-dependent methyltransferase [Acidobacteriota bacterium]
MPRQMTPLLGMTQPSNKTEISAAYDEWAETYDTDLNRTRELAAKALRQAELNFGGRRVIEAGCGTGHNTAWLAESAKSIVALDFSEGMLRRARERVDDPSVRFIKHDVRAKWPLPDRSADVVISMLILEHVEHLEPVFVEAARTLEEGGELFICELHPTRQLLGGQAQFTGAKTGERQLVTAYLHRTEDYANAGVLAGFEPISVVDWRDADANPDDPPRLLSLHYRN